MKEDQEKKWNDKNRTMATIGPLLFSGTQFGITVFIGAWLGKWLDEKYATDPYLLLICSFTFATVGFFNFLKIIKRTNKQL